MKGFRNNSKTFKTFIFANAATATEIVNIIKQKMEGF